MRHLKMLSFAVLAAMGLTAFIGAGTASATTLSTDAAGNIKYGAGTLIVASLMPGTSSRLATTGGSLIATCTVSTAKIEMTTATGTSVGGNMKKTDLTWSGCEQKTETTVGGSLEIMKTGGDEGEVVGKSVSVTLGVFGTSCVYTAGEGTKLGTIRGGEVPVLSISASVSKTSESSFLCPSSGVWTASYVVTEPHSVHIVE